MQQTNPNPVTDEQRAQWVRAQFQEANRFLAEKGILFEAVATEESRYIQPYVAVWKITATDKKAYWVITGDLPTDLIGYSAAANAREAIRHFALGWQLKAENLLQVAEVTDELQQQANAMIAYAEGLSRIHDMDDLWKSA